MTKLKVAVIGVGYLGRFHAQKYNAHPDVELHAVCDSDQARANEVAAELDTVACSDYRSLLNEVDAVSVVVPTQAHYAVVKDCLQHNIDILLEKPMTSTVAQADELIALAKQQQALLQIGHLERFNPVITALSDVMLEPQFIECVRLAPFKPRGTDVNVVLDLMIHDIDIVQSLLHAKPTRIDAIGTPVFTDINDIVNARIHYDNGCVVNYTASRVSLKQERKIRFFQHDAYISIDTQNKQLAMYQKDNNASNPFGVLPTQKSFSDGDPLADEISAFIDCVKTRATPLVSGEDGRQALAIAHEITLAVESQRDHYSRCRQQGETADANC